MQKLWYFLFSFLITSTLLMSLVGFVVVDYNDKNREETQNSAFVFSSDGKSVASVSAMERDIVWDAAAMNAFLDGVSDFAAIAFYPMSLVIKFGDDAIVAASDFISAIITPPTIREDKAWLV